MKNKLVTSLLMTLALGSIVQAQDYVRLNSISELDASASHVQFKNVATGEYVVLANSVLQGNKTKEDKAWCFYQAVGASQNNFEVKRRDQAGFNWANYYKADDNASFIAWNHAKLIPSATAPNAPHNWYLEEVSVGVFRIKHSNGKYLELVQGIIDPKAGGTKLLTKPLIAANLNQQWIIEVTKKKGPQVFNPGRDYVMGKNANGVWEYGFGTLGGDWNRLEKNSARGTGEFWNGNESWKGVYYNPGATDMVMSGGFVVKQGMFVMHPGNNADQLSKVRFTAPADGSYSVDVTWTSIDDAAKKSWVWVFTNAVAAEGTVYAVAPAGYKELLTQGITGFNKSVNFKTTIEMKKGEILEFEIGNGGDGYSDDALEMMLNITKN